MTSQKGERDSIDRDAIIISTIAFGFGALFAWALIDPPMAHQIPKNVAGTTSDLPAWVQAIGSVLAILVAIAVPLWVQHRERRLALEDKRLRVVSFSISMLPAAESFMAALRSALTIATDEDAPDGPDLDHAADTAKVPDALQSKVAELHEVGEPALPLMRAIVMSSQARSELRQAQFYYEHAGEYVDPYTGRPEDIDPPEPYDLTLRNCIEQLGLAIKGMRGVLQ
ncbi:cbb3-type cytochrome c oxidase subunit I [Xanthomonas sp. MWU16-30325]|uniref:cbb3-type cytochrome c oxidase subunit I n=1 Tax=Xanthomonas sp. MWU16-30325 TaxID=2878096 RepID=UPI001CF9044E|nr:cbb3-type cytochrome c oxidase subunit I [Xanthomonas sp. MWU16-30325]